MSRIEHIELDLGTHNIQLRFKGQPEPLVIHFDTPSRRFYFSFIAFIVNEMKVRNQPGFIHIRKHEKFLKMLDDSVAGRYASKDAEDMWGKIRKAWRDRLPDLETATQFKILNRELIPPYEKGGKYRYKCTDQECDAWSNLFQYDESDKWRYKLAVDTVSLGLSDLRLRLGNLRDTSAWEAYVKNISHVKETAAETRQSKIQFISKKRFRPVLAALIIILLIVSTFTIRSLYVRPIPSQVAIESAKKLSIAVMPFVNMNDDPEYEYFCDGITEELINSLARVRDLHVISRTSAFYLKDKALDLKTIGQKLNVDHVLEGSVRVSGDQLRISAQLIKAADDSHLWTGTYNREMKDIFTTQQNLAQEIACSLKSRLGCNGDDVFSKRYTQNVEAYQLYLKGRYFENKMSYDQAIEYFVKAIALDPDYALAYAGLGDAYNIKAFYMPGLVNIKEYFLKAKEACLKAMDLDDMLSEAYTSLGVLKTRYEWDWEGAERLLKRAVDLNPGNALAHTYLSLYLRAMCRLDESIAENKIALELDPLSYYANFNFGVTLASAGYFDKAVEQQYKTLELYPNHPIVLTLIGFAYILSDKIDDGIALLEKAVKVTKRNSPFSLGGLGCAYGMAGQKEKARAILNEALERSKQGYFSPCFIAVIYMGLNDNDNAFKWLDKGYVDRDPTLFNINCGALFSPLRSDPRWSELLKKMGFIT